MAERWRSGSAPRNQNAKVRVAALAARQFGVVSWYQLVALDVSRAMLSGWIRNGYLHRVLPRVYAVGHPALSVDGRLIAAILYAGPGAMLSHASAASWWQLIAEQPTCTHVSTPRRCKSLPGVHVHERRQISRAWHRGLPVTSVTQTLMDYASSAPQAQLRRALSEAEYLRLLKPEFIAPELGRGRPGSAKLRAALGRHLPRLALTRSALEERFLALCERAGVPLPEVNVEVEGLMVDFVWREQRLVVEVDGYAAHATRAQMERDHERDLILRRARIVVLRYTWAQVTRQAREVTGDLLAALDRAA